MLQPGEEKIIAAELVKFFKAHQALAPIFNFRNESQFECRERA